MRKNKRKVKSIIVSQNLIHLVVRLLFCLGRRPWTEQNVFTTALTDTWLSEGRSLYAFSVRLSSSV